MFFFIHFSWESNPGNHNILINSFRNPIFWCQWLFSDPYKATVALLCTSCHVCEKWVGPGKLALWLPETIPHLSTERILFLSTVSSIEVVRQGMFFFWPQNQINGWIKTFIQQAGKTILYCSHIKQQTMKNKMNIRGSKLDTLFMIY